MKNFTFLAVGLLMMAACSTPKYTYHFDRFDYNSGKKKTTSIETSAMATTSNQEIPSLEIEPVGDVSPLVIDKKALVASADVTTPAPPQTTRLEEFKQQYSEMSKRERRAFRKSLKAEVKAFVKNKGKIDNGDTVGKTKQMDSDLRLAIIFGAIALTLSFFGGVNSVFWVVSVVSLVIAVVFFIKWLVRQ